GTTQFSNRQCAMYLLNAGTIAERANSPPWIRRGGCAIKKISRSHISSRRRGGWFKPPIIGSLNQPPRPPLLIQGGEFALFGDRYDVNHGLTAGSYFCVAALFITTLIS